jgi:hypothetical protein
MAAMSDAPKNPQQALVLHLDGGGEPLLVAVAADDAGELAARLPEMLSRGAVEPVTAANRDPVVANFAKGAAAHISAVPPMARIYGMSSRTGGYST